MLVILALPGSRSDRVEHMSGPQAPDDEGTAAMVALPLHFEANRGQADPRARYLARGDGYDLALTSQGAVFGFQGADGRTSVEMGLVGSSPSSPRGLEPLPGRVNYLLGDDPGGWTTEVPTFSRVHYPEVYPGVDLVFRGDRAGGLEYDLILAPRVDPSVPMIRFRGAEDLTLRADGSLAVRTAAGTLINGRPRVWQPAPGGRLPVTGFFRITGNRVRFAIGPHDQGLPLVIDPSVSLAYSTFLGGEGDDDGNAIAVDSEGSVYLTGRTFDATVDLPTTSGAYDTMHNGSGDVFVTKLAPGGHTLAYSTFLGGSGDDTGLGISVDQAGSAYVTGGGWPGFPTTPGAFDTGNNGLHDVFVARLTPAGNDLVYSTFLGSNVTEFGEAIAVDQTGSAYVTGGTGPAFPTTPGAYDPTANGGGETFVTKLTPGGDDLAYSTFLGGNSSEKGAGIAVDGSGAAYVTGYALDGAIDFPTTPGAYDTMHNGNWDVFVTKLEPGGSALVYSTFLGGSGVEEGMAVAVDPLGASYVTGYTIDDTTDFPTTSGAFDTSIAGGEDVFVTKLSPGGNALAYSTFLGGDAPPDLEGGHGIAVDPAGAAYVTGRTFDAPSDFPTTPGAFDTTPNGDSDAFATMIAPGGNALSYSTFLGGGSTDVGGGIAVDRGGSAYVTGRTFDTATDFPTTPGAFDTSHNGQRDAFVTKLSTVYTCRGVSATLIGSPETDQLTGTGSADVVLAGGGNDRVRTLGGADLVCSGDGKDTAAGGGGKDRLYGEKGKDLLKGQGGKDRHVGGPGKDTCVGGGGQDRGACEKEKKIP